MTSIFDLLLSAYIVFTLFDINRANRNYEQHLFLTDGNPRNGWFYFFFKQQIWSIGSIAAFWLVVLLIQSY